MNFRIKLLLLTVFAVVISFSEKSSAGPVGVKNCQTRYTNSGGGNVSQTVCWWTLYHIEGGGSGGSDSGGSSGSDSGGGGGSGGSTSTTTPTTPPTESSCGGNPVLIASGKKYQHSIDHQSVNPWLNVERFYSQTQNNIGMYGHKWMSNHDLSLIIHRNDDGEPTSAMLNRPDGSNIYLLYNSSDENWFHLDGQFAAFGFSDEAQLWLYQAPNGITENYSNQGQLISRFNAQRQGAFYLYEEGDLVEVQTTSGQSLLIEYNEQGLVSIIKVGGVNYQYSYTPENLLETVIQADNTHYKYGYNDERYQGVLTSVHINHKLYAQWEYDDKARAIYSEHAGGAERTEFTYHDNNSTTIKNALGKETTYHFTTVNGKKLPELVEGHESGNCYAAHKVYSYDEYGNKDKITDWQGNITDYDFNSRGLLEQKVEAFGTVNAQTTQYQWHYQYPLLLNTITDHITTDFVYDDNFRLITKTITSKSTGNIRQWHYSYELHDNGNVATKVIDGPQIGNMDTVTHEYDEQGNLLRVINALGHRQQYGNYNALGKAGYKIDINGVKTTFKYDNKGRLVESKIKVPGKDNRITKFSYNSLNQLIETTAANGAKTYYHYNDAFQKVGQTNALGHEINYTLDAAGNVLEKTTIADEKAWTFSDCEIKADSSGCSVTEKLIQETLFDSKVQKSYDALSRITQVNRNGELVGSFTYDANNNLTQASDGEGKTTYYQYDSLNRKIAETDADNQTTYYQYNKQNQITKITDARGNNTTYVYNDFGELVELNSPDSGISHYTYDAAGNKVSHTRADGTTLIFSYDVLGRIIATRHNETQLYQYSYDTCANGIGKLCQLTDISGETHYIYHKTGELKSKFVTLADSQYQLNYHHNELGLVKKITYPSGLKVNYRYNTLGQVIKVKANNETLINHVAYKPFGGIKSWVFGNGQQRAIQYNNKQRISRILATGVQDLRYQYDGASNIISLENLRYDRIHNFDYDALNRLTVIAGSEFASYQYDSLGNRITEENFANSSQYHIATDSNRLESITGPNGERVFTYDDNGNMVTDITENTHKTFVYNAENRMIKSIVNGQEAHYQYNAHGKRVSKTFADGTVIHFIYGAEGQLLAESRNGTIIKEYIYLNGQLVALYNKQSSKSKSAKHKQKKNGKSFLYVHNDHLGRPEIVTDRHQNTVWQAHNQAFGREVIRDDIGNLNIGFPGQYWDEEKHSWYNGFRDYDATIGRYLQSDPIGVNGGINTYNYVLSNPLTFVDILGLGPAEGDTGGGPDEGGSSSPCQSHLNSKQVSTLTLIAQLLETYKTQTSVLAAIQNGYNLGDISAGLLKDTFIWGLKDIQTYQQIGLHVGNPQGSVIPWQTLKIDWNQYGAKTKSPEQVLKTFINEVNKL
ncbi:RHS repeat-associated core domain-containing protein [Litorilituus sediminis]|uniref:RHS repeat protein n=1 Tax=Litorilituus sediminis TaxID=718192 RepID=A0A4P6P7F4_9GAMM|nr:RHS repeat-associated core domain-containing protein [Litorilituus sediminis]QBG35422.1 RHS repeat protein [Litorilituus sediminis]